MGAEFAGWWQLNQDLAGQAEEGEGNVKRSRSTEEEKTNPSVEVLEACCPCLQEACYGNVVFQIEASAIVHSNGCQADTLGRLTRPS